MLKKIQIFLVMFLAGLLPAMAASVKIYESPGRGKRSIEVGDVFYIYIEVTDANGKPEVPQTIGGAKVMYFDHTGQYSMMSNVNGHASQSVSNTWTVTLRATKEGTYTFGPITVGGIKSNTLKFTIGKAQPDNNRNSQSAARASQSQGQNTDKPKFIGKGDGNLFMKASVSESNVYEQQAIVYTVKLYTTYDAVKFIGATSAPKFDGFVTEESKSVSTSFNYETVNGKTYASAVIARYIIFPQMTGQLKVQGNTYTVSVDQREYYHDPFWGNMSYTSPLQLSVNPNDLVINVRPLPSPKPADFSGGVGKFTIASQLKSNSFKTNQAASIEYIVTGTGNLKYVQLPDLSTLYPPQLEVYTPKTEVKDNVGSSNVSGSVSFDYSFMPMEEGDFKIPAVSLVYFNPETGKYETSVSKEYNITVGKGKSSGKSQSTARLRFDPKLKEINPHDLSKEHNPAIYGFAYWLWFIIPFLALVITIAVYLYYSKTHADMAAFNSKRANKFAQRRLRKAAGAMKANNVDLFYDELLTAMWGYLSDKLKMPTSELMRDNIRAVLESSGIPEDNIKYLLEILDKCEFAKYSPEMSRGDMPEVYQNAIDAINKLEKSFKNVKTEEKAR